MFSEEMFSEKPISGETFSDDKKSEENDSENNMGRLTPNTFANASTSMSVTNRCPDSTR